jgi:hypothetical protein
LKENKKFWLMPPLAAMKPLGALLLLVGTGAVAFIYTPL